MHHIIHDAAAFWLITCIFTTSQFQKDKDKDNLQVWESTRELGAGGLRSIWKRGLGCHLSSGEDSAPPLQQYNASLICMPLFQSKEYHRKGDLKRGKIAGYEMLVDPLRC